MLQRCAVDKMKPLDDNGLASVQTHLQLQQQAAGQGLCQQPQQRTAMQEEAQAGPEVPGILHLPFSIKPEYRLTHPILHTPL